MEHNSKNGGGLLSIVATPIGNLQDISLRAIATLKAADRIACEDTRTSAVLLAAHGITTRTVAYHDHNAAEMRPRLLGELAAGRHIALISDAGTPLISDPGYKFVQEAAAQGTRVEPVPGASALITALCASGLPTDRFFFAGFLPPKEQARGTVLAALATLPATLIFYESPRRLAATLTQAATLYGPRDAVVARELTKKFEEFRRAPLPDLAASYADADTPKGEIVLLIAGAADAPSATLADATPLLRAALNHLPLKSAAALVAEQTSLPKRELYQLGLRL